MGKSETGTVWQQTVGLGKDEPPLTLRRIGVRLVQPTQEGDSEIAIIPNLPDAVASAVEISELDRNRWTMEGFFHSLTLNLEGEINPLAYPKAALFAHALVLVCLNLLSILCAA